MAHLAAGTLFRFLFAMSRSFSRGIRLSGVCSSSQECAGRSSRPHSDTKKLRDFAYLCDQPPRGILNPRRLLEDMRVRALFAVLGALTVLAGFSSPSYGQAPEKRAPIGPAAPQSTHHPVLLLAVGSDASWNLRIGPKGPE